MGLVFRLSAEGAVRLNSAAPGKGTLNLFTVQTALWRLSKLVSWWVSFRAGRVSWCHRSDDSQLIKALRAGACSSGQGLRVGTHSTCRIVTGIMEATARVSRAIRPTFTNDEADINRGAEVQRGLETRGTGGRRIP